MAVRWLAHLLVQHPRYKGFSVNCFTDRIDECLNDHVKIDALFTWHTIDEVLSKEKIFPDTVMEEDDEGDEVETTPDWEHVCDEVCNYGWDHDDNTAFLKELFERELTVRPFSEYKEWL